MNKRSSSPSNRTNISEIQYARLSPKREGEETSILCSLTGENGKKLLLLK